MANGILRASREFYETIWLAVSKLTIRGANDFVRRDFFGSSDAESGEALRFSAKRCGAIGVEFSAVACVDSSPFMAFGHDMVIKTDFGSSARGWATEVGLTMDLWIGAALAAALARDLCCLPCCIAVIPLTIEKTDIVFLGDIACGANTEGRGAVRRLAPSRGAISSISAAVSRCDLTIFAITNGFIIQADGNFSDRGASAENTPDPKTIIYASSTEGTAVSLATIVTDDLISFAVSFAAAAKRIPPDCFVLRIYLPRTISTTVGATFAFVCFGIPPRIAGFVQEDMTSPILIVDKGIGERGFVFADVGPMSGLVIEIVGAVGVSVLVERNGLRDLPCLRDKA